MHYCGYIAQVLWPCLVVAIANQVYCCSQSAEEPVSLGELSHIGKFLFVPTDIRHPRPYSTLSPDYKAQIVRKSATLIKSIIQLVSRNDSGLFIQDLVDTPLFREMTRQRALRDITSDMLKGLKISFQSARSGIDGKTRILSIVATLLSNAELRSVLQHRDGKPLTDYEITNARRHALEFGYGGQPITVFKPTQTRIKPRDFIKLTLFLHEDTSTRVGFYEKLKV